jgi:hypothetical protein
MYNLLLKTSEYFKPYFKSNSEINTNTELTVTVSNDIKKNNIFICFICLSSNTNINDPVKLMKEYSFYISSCECNSYIHNKCLDTWIKNTASCPICRNKTTVSLEYNYHKYIYKLTYYVFLGNVALSLIRFSTLLISINIFCVYMYNFYIFYYVNIDYDEFISYYE